MKRALIAVITALPLAVGVASAQADGFPGWPGTIGTPQVAVAGTVVSTSGSSIMANAYVVTPPSMGDDGSGDDGGLPGFGSFGFGSFPSFGSFPGFGGSSFGGSGFGGSSFSGEMRTNDLSMPTTPPTTTPVTINTTTSTMITIGGVGDDSGTSAPTVSDLVPGTRFIALFPGSSTDPITTIVGNPATAIFAEIPKQFYAFVGTVTGTAAATTTTPGTVTVNVMDSMPSGLLTAGSSATFTVSDGTLIIGGSGGGTGFSLSDLFGGSLSNVSTGDMVAGGLIGPGGLTAAQVESMPLMFMLDLPAPPASSSSSVAHKALNETMTLLHGGKVKLGKKHAKRSHHSKRSKHTRRSARH